MKIRTNVKGGALSPNHNETQVRDTNRGAGPRVKTPIIASAMCQGVFLGLSAITLLQSAFGQNLCTPTPSGLVSWWSAENNNDIVGANNSTAVAATSFMPGMVGQAFYFNGVIPSTTPPSPFDLPKFTVEAWIRPDKYGTAMIVSKGWMGPNYETINYEFALTGSVNQVAIDFYPPSYGPHNELDSNATCPVGQWCHVAGSYDGTILRVYVNGMLSGTLSTVARPPTTDIHPHTFHIGQRFNGTYPFQGPIDEVDIFNRALTDNEILAIYNAGQYGKCKP